METSLSSEDVLSVPKFLEHSSFLSSLAWLQADVVEFEADSDDHLSDSETELVMERPCEPQRRDNSASWGPIRRERWRQRKIKEQEKLITFRDWLLTGTYVHSNVMIDAGLYGIDVSAWKDADFDCLNPELVNSSNLQQDDLNTDQFSAMSLVEHDDLNTEQFSAMSLVAEHSSAEVVDPSTSASFSQVDVSSWKDDDFKIPERPVRERKDLKGKIKKSTNNQSRQVPKVEVTQSDRVTSSERCQVSQSIVANSIENVDFDVSTWSDDDFSQK